MGSLASHVVTTLFLLPVGLTRLAASTSLYLSNPTHFRSKPAYLLFLHPKWNNLPLYFLLISLPISSFSLSFLFLGTHRFSLLHHALLLLLFWVLAILVLLRDSVDPALVNDALLFAFAGAAFLVDYWLTGDGVSGIVPRAVYGLSGDLALLCGFCCLCLAVIPDAFFVEFGLCCGLVFRGLWSMQSGLCLYSDAFAPEGCKTVAVVDGAGIAEMKCDLDEDALRAVALLNFLFVVYAFVVVVLGLGIYGFLARCRGFPRHGEEVGTSVVRGGSESNFVRGGPVFELE